MDLTLTELVRPAGERFWQPFVFDEAGDGFTVDWWHPGPAFEGHTYLKVMEGGVEVGRVDLDDEVYIEHYAHVPDLGEAGLEIQFIEVHADHRRRGLGRAIVDLVGMRYPSRRLVAFSEGADGFWSSLGWARHLHSDPEDAPFYRPLFIQPGG